jgi:hypothetical protein
MPNHARVHHPGAQDHPQKLEHGLASPVQSGIDSSRVIRERVRLNCKDVSV